jgi:hypothetical protein
MLKHLAGTLLLCVLSATLRDAVYHAIGRLTEGAPAVELMAIGRC